MDLAPRSPARTVRLRRLAAELRRLRVAAGLSQQQVADRTRFYHTTLFRLERGDQRPQGSTLRVLLDLYGVTDEVKRAELFALAKQGAAQVAWLRGYEEELSEHYATFISFEADARSVRNYETSFIPGLLQTEAYTRAVIQGIRPEATAADIERGVEVRRQRRMVLEKDEPIELAAIVDEAVLHRVVGGEEVLIEQLRALVEAASRPNITLQVLPWGVGAHPGMHGGFAIMDFPDEADVDLVYVESLVGAMFMEQEDDIEAYSLAFETLQAAALSPAESKRLIASLADGRYIMREV